MVLSSSERMIKDPGPDDQDTKESNLQQRLFSLAQNLLRKRDEAVVYRSGTGVERRWRADEEAFDSLTEEQKTEMIDYATGEAAPRGNTGPIRSRVVVNVLRSKCETAEGRFCDILLPVDDRNWGLKPTPVPELAKAVNDARPVINTETNQPLTNNDGSPVKASDIAKAKIDQAQEAMEAMENEIDDQLTECSFNGECRKVIRDAVRSGTGIIKGPNVVKQIRKAWIPAEGGQRKVFIMKAVEDPTPVSKRVDYWNVYPDPQCGDDVKRASYMWEYDEILPRELRAMIGLEGYFSHEIEKVLEEDPIRTTVAYNENRKRNEIKRLTLANGLAYEKWEYHGDVDRDDLVALGVDVAELKGKSLSACVVFVNEHPIKVQLNVLDTGDLPFDFFQWCQVKNTPWGIGVVRIGTWAQRVIQAAWRGTMDNARDSSGANVIVGPGVEPVDGRWEITGKKLWRMVSAELDDVRKAFLQFQLESRQVELAAIIEMAIKFLDMETALPMIFQGEGNEIPETLGATNIMVDSNNVAIRSRVKIWDDQITRPHITRYYHWNMQYAENPDIKGDYNVDPRGTSVLLARDQQARTLVNLMALRNDPRVDAEVDWGKAVRELFTSLRLNVLKSKEDKVRDEEARKNQPEQPQDPKIAASQIKSQAELQKADLVQKSDMAELQFKATEAERQRAFDREMRQMDLQIRMMEFAQEREMQLADVKKELSVEASKQGLMRELAEKKTAELTKPPIEPPQKAPAGESYQQ